MKRSLTPRSASKRLSGLSKQRRRPPSAEDALTVNDRRIHELLNSRRFQQAKTLLMRRLKQDPDNAEVHYLWGIFHFYQGQIKKTVESLRKALELNANHTDAAICLSVLYNDIGKYREAKSTFQQANQSISKNRVGDNADIDLKFAAKHLELADLYFRYKRYDEATEEYDKAVILNPTDVDTKIRRAKALAKKGYLTRAIQELQNLKSEHPAHMEVRLQLGFLHFGQGNMLDAELEWEGVLDMDPDNADAQNYIEMAKNKRVLR